MKPRLIILVVLIIIYSFMVTVFPQARNGIVPAASSTPVVSATTSSPIFLAQAPSLEQSSDKTWWLKSGGKLFFEKDFMRTDYIQDTFLAIEKSMQDNFRQFFYFNIQNTGEGASGLFLLSRYTDDTTYYQIGFNAPDSAVIIKKSNGKSVTLAEKKLSAQLPIHTWMGLQSDVVTGDDGKVSLKLYMDLKGDNNWTLLLETIDEKDPILKSGHPAILSHFLDLQFSAYKIEPLY